MVYDTPLSVIEKLEATATRYLKRWLSLIRSSVPEYLYTKRRSRGLGLQSLTTLYKRLQLSRAHLLKYSMDAEVRKVYRKQAQQVRNTLAKWDPVNRLEQHEQMLINVSLLNEQIRQRSGIGHAIRRKARHLDTMAEKRAKIGDMESDYDNARRIAHLQSLEMQGLWASWDHVMQLDLKWQRLLNQSMSDALLKSPCMRNCARCRPKTICTVESK